jgi:hypothetical protein
MGWNPLDSPVDYALVAGKRTPGLAIVEKASAKLKWDQAQGYALSGAIARYTGDELADFILRIQLRTTEEWEAWDEFKTIVAKPPRGVRPKALDFWHPFTADLGVTSVVVKERSQPNPIEDGTVFEITIALMQYRRPKPQYAAPEAAKTQASEDPYDKAIERLAAQVAERAGDGR